MGQAAQEYNHLLRFKPLLAAFPDPQALFVAFEGGLHAPATLIVEADRPQEHSNGIKASLRVSSRQVPLVSGKQGGDEDRDAPLPIGFALAHRDAHHLAHIRWGGLFDPTDLSACFVRVRDPGGDGCRQASSALARVILAKDLVALAERPVHVVRAAAAGIDPQQRTSAFGLGKHQGLLSGLNQWLKGGRELGPTLKEPVDNHLPVAAGQHPAQLASTAVACSGEGAFGRQCRLLATGQATEIHIQNLVLLVVISR